MKKLMLFGAGKIGRSFIGQLFSKSGYEVVFVDIFPEIIDALNTRKAYDVVIKSNEGDSVIKVENVRGILASNQDAIVEELVSADIVAVSVGQRGLPSTIETLAKGLDKRFIARPRSPLDIIIAENLRNADEYFRNEFKKLLPASFPLAEYVGLVETSIGKMVPIMSKKDTEADILRVFAEPYNTLILDKKGFRNPVPDVAGLAPKENMKAWVDRKLFIHNLGHAASAYLGYVNNTSWVYIWEALAVDEIKNFVRETMLQAGDTLIKMYPDEFDKQHIIDHTDDLIARFGNKALGDTIYRVGCDLFRKLSKEDRLVGAINNARKQDMPYEHILYILVCSFYFAARDEQGNLFPTDREFSNVFFKGMDMVLEDVCRFDRVTDADIYNQVEFINREVVDTYQL